VETAKEDKGHIAPGENIQIETKETPTPQRNLQETEDPEEVVRQKVKILAQWVQQSKHCIIFTGAGISTSAAIPDYRGPNGVWTLKDKGIQVQSIRLEQAVPTVCHMGLVALLNNFNETNRVLYIISQNIDGLHLRSGISKHSISELHGNSYLESCWDCGKEYLRTFDTTVQAGIGGQNCQECLKKVPMFCHCTERKCDCGNQLKDSVVDFGEPLPAQPLTSAVRHASQADLCIVLGSSLTVSPANIMPKKTKKNYGNVCIVNLQETELDSISDLRIFAKTDLLTQLLLEELGISIPQFDMNRFFMDPAL